MRLILIVALLGGMLRTGAVTGRVTDTAGVPLAGVRVISLPWADTRTGPDGRFALPNAAELARFSKAGYRPVTKPTRGGSVDVALDAAADSMWAPPVCSPKSDGRFGATMMFNQPPGVSIRTSSDVDYHTVAARFRDSVLEFGAGPHWTYGLPLAQVFEAMVRVQERDVRTPWADPAAEYRGVRANGKRWRGVYLLGESISYDDADPVAAEYFDRVIDSLCFKW